MNTVGSEGSTHFYEDLTPGTEFSFAVDTLQPATLRGYRDFVEGNRSDADADSPVPGSLLMSLIVEKYVKHGPLADSFVAFAGLEYTFARLEVDNEQLLGSTLITHRQLHGDSTRGDVQCRVTVRTTTREIVLDGTVSLVVLTRSPDAARHEEEMHPSFVSPLWLASLTERLSTSEEFAQVAEPFDGSIAIDFGVNAMGLRMYRGRVIDSGRSVANSATFSVGAPPSTWHEFASRPHNHFVVFAMRGAFTVRGSTSEYLRMTKALVVLTDQVRALMVGE